MARYFTLAIRASDHSPWEIAFGDYDPAIVAEEATYEYRHIPKHRRKIIRTSEAQADIDAAIEGLNVRAWEQANN